MPLGGGEEQEEEPQSVQDAEDGPNHPGGGTGAEAGSLRLLDSWFEATCLRAFARSLQLSQEFGLVPGDSHPHSPLSSTPIVVSASLVDSVCACEGTEVLPSQLTSVLQCGVLDSAHRVRREILRAP